MAFVAAVLLGSLDVRSQPVESVYPMLIVIVIGLLLTIVLLPTYLVVRWRTRRRH